MMRLMLVGLLAAVGAGVLGMVGRSAAADEGSKGDRVFEIRTYHCLPGRLPALNKRFQEHTIGLFKKHGIESVAYWTPADDKDGKADTLIYVLAYPSREAAKKSWAAFQADPDWIKARDESEKDGKIISKIESVYLNPTQYSMMK